MNREIRIGYVPTRRSNFSVTEALRCKERIREAVSGFPAELIDIDDINSEGLLLEQPAPALQRNGPLPR